MQSKDKNLIFISHATPEDNVFTLWLSTRLKLLGYEVWSDVTQLFGGEKWWQDIDEAINLHTAKFVLVITKQSLSKPGVQKELELALEAEKSNGLANFIIPVIIDDSSFGGQPYDLSDRNIISFTMAWATGLAKLVKRCKEDKVSTSSVIGNLSSSLQSHISGKTKLEIKDSIVLSNWVEIESIPNELSFYRLPIKSKNLVSVLGVSEYSWFEWRGMVGTFDTAQSIERLLSRGMSVTTAPKLNLNSVIKNTPRNHPELAYGEVLKLMNHLILDSWDKRMAKSGLHAYSLSSGKKAWFYPDSDEFGGLQTYPDINGELRKRAIQGYSAKNKVFWHYAVQPKIQYGPQPKICLIPHVVFSEDGKNPLKDKAKMHRLRRGFCKMWWNDRWRDMLLTYLHLLSEGEEKLEIDLGSNSVVNVSSRPMTFIAPIELVEPSEEKFDEDAVDDADVDLIEVDEGIESEF